MYLALIVQAFFLIIGAFFLNKANNMKYELANLDPHQLSERKRHIQKTAILGYAIMFIGITISFALISWR